LKRELQVTGQIHSSHRPDGAGFRRRVCSCEDDKHITTIDADGVALAAIQGLNQKFDEKDAMIDAQQIQIGNQQTQIDDLRERLSRLERLITSMTNSERHP